jgi:hypothetical protein
MIGVRYAVMDRRFVFVAKKDKKDPQQYPLTAHVVSAERTYTPGTYSQTSAYDPQTGQWVYGHASSSGSADATVQFQIGNLLYTGGYRCRKHVQVGTDVHARLEKNKLFILTNDGQTCDTHVRGVSEISKQGK